MPDGAVYALTLESGLAAAFSIPVQPIVRNGTVGRMHIAKAGEWKGHPSGAFQFDADLFDKLVARFEARGTKALLVDYSHKSERGSDPEDIKAGGWIRDLWRTGDGDNAELWAVVEFTAKAAEMIAAGELLFCSPVVAWEVPDTRSGKAGPELISAALTNSPFQDHLQAIALTRKVAAAFPPPKAKAKGDEEQEPAEPEGEAPPAADEPPPAEGEPTQEEPPPPADGNPPPVEDEGQADPLMAIATELGLDRATVCAVVEANKDVFAQAIGAALEKQRKEQMMATPQVQPPPAATQLQRDVEDLKKQLADERKQLAADRAEAAKALVLSRVDALIAQGHGTEDMRDYMVFEFTKDATAAAAKFAEKVVPVGETQAGNRDQVRHKVKLTELSGEERTWLEAVTKARLMKTDEAMNRIVARREVAAGKAA